MSTEVKHPFPLPPTMGLSEFIERRKKDLDAFAKDYAAKVIKDPLHYEAMMIEEDWEDAIWLWSEKERNINARK